MAFTPEKAGWSAAPEVVADLARQKAICDEGLAQIRAGLEETAYLYWFGRLESMWRYVFAVSRRGTEKTKEDIETADKMKTELLAKILEHWKEYYSSDRIPLLEEERKTRVERLKSEIVQQFDAFYQNILFIGVDNNLFSYQRGGEWRMTKNQRLGGVPEIQ